MLSPSSARGTLGRLAVRASCRPRPLLRTRDAAPGPCPRGPAGEVGVPGLTSRLDLDELRRRLGAVDLVAADIDECIFPGFSQTYLGYLTFLRLTTAPGRPGDLALLPQLLHGGLYIRKVSLLHRLGRTPANRRLMARYERSMMGVPRSYFLDGAARIPGRSFPGALEALALLARRGAVVGTVSFGVHVISEAYGAALARLAPGARLYCEANTIRFEPRRAGGRPRFVGYRRPLRCEPEEKAHQLERRLAQFGARRPLVIGNGRDEAVMAELARRRGGLAVGIAPVPEDEAHFDVLVRGDDWRPLLGLLGSASGHRPAIFCGVVRPGRYRVL